MQDNSRIVSYEQNLGIYFFKVYEMEQVQMFVVKKR